MSFHFSCSERLSFITQLACRISIIYPGIIEIILERTKVKHQEKQNTSIGKHTGEWEMECTSFMGTESWFLEVTYFKFCVKVVF